MMNVKPVILLAFANSRENPLKELSYEEEAIYNILLRRGIKEESIHVIREPYADIENIFKYLTDYIDQIEIFHFGGHANSTKIFIDEKEVDLRVLAEILARRKRLKLIFLNGCATAQRIENLLAMGIPAIIGTQSPVNDLKARNFAVNFYTALVAGMTYEEAFKEASGYTRLTDEIIEINIHRDFNPKGKELVFGEERWGLFNLENQNHILEEKLPKHEVIDHSLDFEPNSLLIESIWETFPEASGEFEKDEFSIRAKRRLILEKFPGPLAEHLRLLMVRPLDERRRNSFDKISQARVNQISITHVILMEFLIFTLLAQLWDMNIKLLRVRFEKEEKELPDSIDGFEFSMLNLPKETRRGIYSFLHMDKNDRESIKHMPLIQLLVEALLSIDHPNTFFVEEMAKLGELVEPGTEFFEACLSLDILRLRLRIKAGNNSYNITTMCYEAEKSLALLFKELGYLANYTLATIKNIEVNKHSHTFKPDFTHVIVKLKDMSIGIDKERKTLDNHLDSKSVVLLKESGKSKGSDFLNLSPFIIDDNVFTPDTDLAKIYFFHHHQNGSGEPNGNQIWYYRYIFQVSDPHMRIDKKKYKVLIELFRSYQKIYKENE